MAAGSAARQPAMAANLMKLAPEFHPTKYSLQGFLRSAAELVSQEPAANSKNKDENEHEHEHVTRNSASQVLWARSGLGASFSIHVEDVQKPSSIKDSELCQCVDIPQVSPSALPHISSSDTQNGTSDFTAEARQNANQTSPSEDSVCVSPPLRKLKLSLKLPKLTKLHLMSQLSPKSVRFASRLEKVKMFDGKDSPSAVSLQCSPCGSPRYEIPCIDEDSEYDYFSILHPYNDISDEDNGSSSDSDTFSEYASDKQYKILLSNFVSPQNIFDKRHSPVYLQSVSFTSDRKLLVLLMMCQNLAFKKKLSVKMTFNAWQSQLIFNSAVYTRLFPSVNFDQFKLTIPLTHLPSSLSAQFCVRYDVNGATFWDNNNTQNYRFELGKFTKPSVAKDMFNFKPSAVASSQDSFAKKDSFTYKRPSFSQKSGSEVKAGSFGSSAVSKPCLTVPQYNELVTKLMSVKVNDEGPTFGHFQKTLTPLASLATTQSPKPRYLQTHLAKKAPEASGQMLPLARKSTNVTSANDDLLLKNSVITTDKPPMGKPSAFAGLARLPLPHSHASAPNLGSANIKSMSYADILQNYCFNGAEELKTFRLNSIGSCISSCNSSSASLNSEYMTPASTFHSMNDSFFV